jgi:GH15 family glucan-1,4-alpha-glucosidase
MPAGNPDYLPIAEHGVIGDQRSVALVGTDGTIDWYCPDRFDGPSVFAAVLDRHRGGFYRVAPVGSGSQTKQMYLPETNVLITRFLSPDGVSEVQDFMPLGTDRQRLIRRVVGVRGCVHQTEGERRGRNFRRSDPYKWVTLWLESPSRSSV